MAKVCSMTCRSTKNNVLQTEFISFDALAVSLQRLVNPWRQIPGRGIGNGPF